MMLMPLIYGGIGFYLATIFHEKTANNIIAKKIAQEEIVHNKHLLDAYAAAIAYQKKLDGSFDSWVLENKNKVTLSNIPSEAVESAKQEILQGQLMHSLATYNEDRFLPSLSPAQNY